MKNNERQRAEQICRQRISANADDVEAIEALAMIIKDTHPDEALGLFGRAFELRPDNIDLRFERGNLLRRLRRDRDAIRDFVAVLDKNPRHFRALTNLGNALREFGKLEGALRCYERAIDAGGDHPAVKLNMAIVLHQMERSDDALRLLRDVQAEDPRFDEACFEEGRVLAALNRHDDALAAFERGFVIEPGNARALNSRGNLFSKLFRFRPALADFDAALVLQPDFHEALNNRANLLRNMGRFDDALADYDRALALRPDLPKVLVNRGSVLNDMSRLQDALDSLQSAIDLDPSIPEAYLHAGRIYSDVGRMVEADDLFDRALALKPDLWEGWFYKGSGLRETGSHDKALQCFRRILEANPDEVNLPSLGNFLFSMNFDDHLKPEDYLEQARLFGQVVARRVPRRYEHAPAHSVPPVLKVGIVSGDLKHHPVGFFLRNVLPHLARGGVRLFAYSNNGDHDDISEELKSACAAWHAVAGMRDADLAAKILADGIHILIDLSGHTDKSRLPVFAWKPAPVQATWLGYCASTGLAEIDYVLGDRIVTPLEDGGSFVEKIWQLPGSYFCFSPPKTDLPVAPSPALASGQFTFGCFNKLSKISDEVVAVWSRILLALPSSKLLLKTAVLADARTRELTVQRFGHHGVSPAQLLMSGASNYEDYLQSYGSIDLALDPFPYPGATTTLEGLWMGVPCLTLKGRRFLARNGETIAWHAGLADFIATDIDDYVARAVRIASDIPRLAAIRDGLREQVRVSPLFDGVRFAAGFEAALREIWARHCVPAA